MPFSFYKLNNIIIHLFVEKGNRKKEKIYKKSGTAKKGGAVPEKGGLRYQCIILRRRVSETSAINSELVGLPREFFIVYPK